MFIIIILMIISIFGKALTDGNNHKQELRNYMKIEYRNEYKSKYDNFIFDKKYFCVNIMSSLSDERIRKL